MKASYGRSLAVFASLGLGAAAVQSVHAQSEPSAHVMSEIKMRDPGVGVTYVPRAQSKTIGGLDAAAAESTVSLFRVVVVVHGINSEWNETFAINPEYPSFQVCEAARDELVEDFLYILKRRYLQPFNVDSRCVKSDGEV